MSTPISSGETLGSMLEKQAIQSAGQLLDHLAAEGINKVVKPATPTPPATPPPTTPAPKASAPAPATELAAPKDERPDAVLPLDPKTRTWLPTGGERWQPGLNAEPSLPATPEKPAEPARVEPDLERLLDEAAAHQAKANALR